MGRQNNNPDDHSCLLAMNLTDHMFEFRYHEDQVGYFYKSGHLNLMLRTKWILITA